MANSVKSSVSKIGGAPKTATPVKPYVAPKASVLEVKKAPARLNPYARKVEPSVETLRRFHIPSVQVTPEALAKMARYVGFCTQEIGWLGTAYRLPGSAEDNLPDTYLIKDVFLFRQEVNAATTEISSEGLGEFATGILMDRPDEAMDILNNLRIWGHSHVNMDVHPSGQDDSQMEVFENSVMETENKFMIRLIANKKGLMKIDVYDYEAEVAFHDVEWSVLAPAHDNLNAEITGEIQELVTPKTYTAPKAKPLTGGASYGGTGSYGGSYGSDDGFGGFGSGTGYGGTPRRSETARDIDDIFDTPSSFGSSSTSTEAGYDDVPSGRRLF